MGNCRICGKPAGIFRRVHRECEEQRLRDEQQRERELAEATKRAEEGRERALKAIALAICLGTSLEQLDRELDKILLDSGLPQDEKRALLIKGWSIAADSFLDDQVLESDEEERLIAPINRFQLTQAELNENGSQARVAKAGAIRDLLRGSIPKRFSFNGELPINLIKGEQLVWAFIGTKYYEDRIKREYVGRSHGASIRVMRGVYYRVGGFRGIPIETTERAYIATGTLFVTNLHLYFSSPSKSFRIPYRKIVAFEPFTDGIGITRDAASAKPQVFSTDDGWFTYNLVVNLARM